jgi:hypothetical protein
MSLSNQSEVVKTPLLTREQLRQRLNERGYVISAGYFSRLCLPSRNMGPPIETWWGSRPLYDLEAGLAWAEGRCKPPGHRLAGAAG